MNFRIESFDIFRGTINNIVLVRVHSNNKKNHIHILHNILVIQFEAQGSDFSNSTDT